MPNLMQELCGHEDVNTTMGYNHADRARGFSPMDVSLEARRNVRPPLALIGGFAE